MFGFVKTRLIKHAKWVKWVGALANFLESLQLTTAGETVPTYPSTQPGRGIDHLFTRGPLRFRKYAARPVLLSDHLPLMSQVELSKPK